MLGAIKISLLNNATDSIVKAIYEELFNRYDQFSDPPSKPSRSRSATLSRRSISRVNSLCLNGKNLFQENKKRHAKLLELINKQLEGNPNRKEYILVCLQHCVPRHMFSISDIDDDGKFKSDKGSSDGKMKKAINEPKADKNDANNANDTKKEECRKSSFFNESLNIAAVEKQYNVFNVLAKKRFPNNKSLHDAADSLMEAIRNCSQDQAPDGAAYLKAKNHFHDALQQIPTKDCLSEAGYTFQMIALYTVAGLCLSAAVGLLIATLLLNIAMIFSIISASVGVFFAGTAVTFQWFCAPKAPVYETGNNLLTLLSETQSVCSYTPAT